MVGPVNPGLRFSSIPSRAGTVADRPRPRRDLRNSDLLRHCPESLVLSLSSRKGPRATVALDFVTTVDQSDIRGFGYRHELDPSGASSTLRTGVGRLVRPASRVCRGFPLTVLPTRPLPLDLSLHPQSFMLSIVHSQAASSVSSRPIAHRKPARSRPTAVTASTATLRRPI